MCKSPSSYGSHVFVCDLVLVSKRIGECVVAYGGACSRVQGYQKSSYFIEIRVGVLFWYMLLVFTDSSVHNSADAAGKFS